MSPPQQLRQQTSNCSSLLIYRPWKDERLSWPSWLTYSGWLTHIRGHPSATSRAQDSESTSAKDQCYTAGPLHQLTGTCYLPNSWVHSDRHSYLVFMSQLLVYLLQTRLLFTVAWASQQIYGHLLHFAWVVDDAKCIVVTRVCVSVCPRPHAHTIARTRV